MEPIPVDQDSDEDPMMADDQHPGSGQTRPTGPNIQDSSFRDFIENDLMKPLEAHSPEAWHVYWVFIGGMGSAAVHTRLVAVHEAIDSGLTRRARVETVGNFLKAVAEKCGGNANLRDAWYGGTRDEICKILRYGFSVSNLDEHGTVRLVPVNVSLEAAKLSR